ncbi:MAG TPA: proton-conducting transporter membrane subunit [Ilumatobacteraceae bacterium]|nr:proton-conducting transporter membrane subunit [Ilumatobacteraceae bacterium]
MSWFLIAVPTLPLLAALLVVAGRLPATSSARLAIGASVGSVLAAVAVLVAAGVDGPVDAVVTDDAGRALVGLTADRVGAVLIMLTTLVGMVVQSFGSRSLRDDPRARRFHVLALVLASATSTVAIAATATGLLVAWIATSVALVALLGHRSPWPSAVEAQRRAGASFVIGDVALLIAVAIALFTIGDVDMRSVGVDAVALGEEDIFAVGAITIIAVLLVVAGAARSAIVPIHRWLPATLAAPTPVSALLHAGVINGAGVLFLRFSPVFGSSVVAMSVAFAIGVLTAVLATAIMLVRTDVKGALVWSTSGQMGFMVMQLGVGAFAAALFHIVGHALYKAALFLGAGGAISALNRQIVRPHLGREDTAVLHSRPMRVTMGLLVPAACFALALALVDPHLTPAATILVVVFGTLSVGRAANGWLSSTPFGTGRSVAWVLAGVVVAVFGYIGGITLFETFVVDVVPYDVPAAVGPIWVLATLIGLAVVVFTVAFAPGERGDRLRRASYSWLLSTGSATPLGSPRRPLASAPTPVTPHPSPTDLVVPVPVGERS